MNAGYKAKELVERYFDIIPFNDNELSEEEMYEVQLSIVKQCAIICVDEMLDCNSTSVDSEDEFEFWKEVKLEINKL